MTVRSKERRKMGRAPCCTKFGLSRGQWTTEEDALLIKYIQAHGEGYWKSLPKKAGLRRCGKSCRLRWKNYLQPDIKLGNIGPDEEELIIRLHSLLGNRWSLIAGRLPVRTDNEIKNYWNTNLSRRFKSEVIDQKHPKAASKTRKNTKQDSDGETKTKIKVYRPKAVKVSPFPMSKLRGYKDRHVEVDQLVVSNGPWSSSDLNDAQNGVEANPGVSPFPTSVLPGYGDRNVRVDQLVVSNGPWSSSNINDAQNRVEAILGVSPFPPSVLPGYGDRNHLVVTNGPWSSSDPNDAQNGVEANLGVNDYDGYVPLQNSEQRHADKLEKIYEEFQQLVTAEDETALDSFVSSLLV